ncbi:MAG: NYN domain-containing protein [Acidobacteria bacterium]|nr:NYN domain-containing protein [Acidobacteriota bacterium]
MQDKLNIAVFVDYDNIEIGVKSTLRRDFHVAPVLDALKERGLIAAKFAYANWGRQEGATRQMAENAVQMVQRVPTPRGDKNGGDINLALDALEMAFTHKHINAFAIVSGDSDFIPLVNKLKEYGKIVFIVGGKAFTSTILQQNCNEFISYESLVDMGKPVPTPAQQPSQGQQQQPQRQQKQERAERPAGKRPEPLSLSHAVPLVERALEVLERREVQPQLGLLKSTMLQLSPTFSERDYGARSFSDFVEMLAKADYIKVSGTGGKSIIERKSITISEQKLLSPEDALPVLEKVLAAHAADLAAGLTADQVQGLVSAEQPDFDLPSFGFQGIAELLNFAQDRALLRTELDEDRGLIVFPPVIEPHYEPEPEPEFEPAQEAVMVAAASAAGVPEEVAAEPVLSDAPAPAVKRSGRSRRKPASKAAKKTVKASKKTE